MKLKNFRHYNIVNSPYFHTWGNKVHRAKVKRALNRGDYDNIPSIKEEKHHLFMELKYY